MKWILILLFNLTLLGCSFLNNPSKVVVLRKSAYDHCQATYSNELDRAKCINQKYLQISKEHGIPYQDITEISNAVRLSLASKIVSNSISQEQAKIAMAGAGYILDAEEENRKYAKGAYPKEKWQSQNQ
ncbi:hypothetical protein [Microbulbifer spongiae]|uniref:Lipoprotein n=1 Tax=Microbulbifer spongiae TaxID=2944933 RepID=A0ABY9EDK2_9GAMM|nr:hypothetical protein [Microbulbifer sp. MI-G]WKD49609.1 hypothetical protein M8T91_17230 [Microbulbifer sp. MI-G]